MSESSDYTIDLRQVAAILWLRRAAVIGITLAAVLVATVWSLVSPPLYEAQGLIQLSEDSPPPYDMAARAAQLLRTRTFLASVAGTAHLSESEDALLRAVRVEALYDARMVRVRVRLHDPERAHTVAQAIVGRFVARATEPVERSRQNLERRLAAGASALVLTTDVLRTTRALLERPAGQVPDQGGRAFLLNALSIASELHAAQLATQRELLMELRELESPAVIDAPVRPVAPIAPRMGFIVTLGFLLGLFVGGVVALVPREEVSPRGVPQSASVRAVVDPPARTESQV